eukprot:1765105-Amphidinium_carterae.2
MATRLPADQHVAKVLNCVLEACRQLELDVLAQEDGTATVIATLESVFGDPSDVALIEAADAHWEKWIRI